MIANICIQNEPHSCTCTAKRFNQKRRIIKKKKKEEHVEMLKVHLQNQDWDGTLATKLN